MPILVREDIEERMARGNLVFTPELDAFQLQAHTIDLRLGFTFLVPRLWQVTERGRVALVFDPLEGGHAHFDPVELEPGQYFEMLPGERVLVSTLERITMPNDISAMSRIGFAACPGTDVDPACSSSITRSPSAARIFSASPAYRTGHSGS